MTPDKLIAACRAGEITEPMRLDNDAAYAYSGNSKVFGMHPGELLETLPAHAGIPARSA